MPYRSKRQMRWAHATRQPWAKAWDRKTKNPRRLPVRARRKKRSR